jgi:hypothetical protein
MTVEPRLASQGSLFGWILVLTALDSFELVTFQQNHEATASTQLVGAISFVFYAASATQSSSSSLCAKESFGLSH